MGVGRRTGITFFCFSLFHEFESPLVQKFEIFQEFGLFREFCKILRNLQVQCSMIAALGLTVNRWLGGEKVDLYIVFFCIVIISIINTIISGTISIYSVALLNCHYLNQ